MQVFLIRHAEAIDETLSLRDPHHHLTAHGRAQARALGERLRWHDCEPTRILTSPLVRAVQTAELIAVALGAELLVESDLGLGPDADPRDVAQALRSSPSDAIVVVVGHEPNLSALGALLANDADFPALAKAEAVRIDDGRLKWRFAWNADAPTPYSPSSDA